MNIMANKATPIAIGAILSIGATLIGFRIGSDHIEGAQLAARWTSRVGVPVFLTAYLASSFMRLTKNNLTAAIMRTRRQWGLAFALTHSVHLVALICYLTIAGMPPDTITLLGGGLAYTLLYLMALTSNNWSVRLLGKNWKRLHVVGIHYLWLIYTFTYLGRLFDSELILIGVIGTSIMVLALLFRLTMKWQSKTQPTETVAQ